MNFLWRKPPRDPNAPPRKKPGPQPYGKSLTSMYRNGRKHIAGLARSGALDDLVDELCTLIKGKANNVYLIELMRLRDREIKLLDRTRLAKVMQVYGKQSVKNDEHKRAAERERAALEARVDQRRRR